MSVYLAPFSESAASAHPIFKAKGIVTHTAGPLKEISVVGIGLEPQIAYSGYVANLPIFVAATNRQHTLATKLSAVALTVIDRPVIPISLPRIAFIPRMKMSADQLDAFVKKLEPFGATSEVSGKVTKITLSKANLDIAQKVMQGAQEFSSTTPNEILPRDAENFCWLVRVMSEFLATNTYPAYTTPVDEKNFQIAGMSPRDWYLGEGYVRFRGKWAEAAMAKLQSDRVRLLKLKGYEEEEKKELDDSWKNIDYTKWITGYALMDHETTVTAKASPVPLSFNCGSISEHPGNYPGLLFPYFTRMNIPDKFTLRSIVLKHFYRLMGATPSDCETHWISLRQSMDRIAGTPSGMALAHMFYGMDLALQTQTRMFVIWEDSEYLGFSLLGERFVLYDGRAFLRPVAPKILNEQIAKLSSHHAALERIAELLSGCSLRVEGMETQKEIAASDLGSSYQLVEEILLRKIADEIRDAIVLQTKHLRFKEEHFRNTPDRIEWVLERLTVKKDLPLDPSIPQYIPNDFALLEDRLFRLLAAYGPDAPSLYNGQGRDLYKLVRPVQTTNGYDLPATAERPLKLHVAMKGIVQAHADWKKVLKDKEIRMDFKERAGKNRCAVFTSKDAVNNIFYGLCSWVTSVDRSKKRKAEDEGGDGEDGPSKPSKPKRGPQVDTADAFLSLF